MSQRKPEYAMMSAFALCPTETSHVERMKWIAEYFMHEMNFSLNKPKE